MKKVIIAIHGLGNKPPKYLLKKWWKDAIQEGLINSGFDYKIPTFELVYWADILYDKPLNYWIKDNKSKYYLDEPYTKAKINNVRINHSFRKKINDMAISIFNHTFLNNDKTLKNRFISEFIIQKYFHELKIYYTENCNEQTDFNCKAKKEIQQRLLETIHKYKDYDIMLIAHSMGSIIAYDVLNYLTPKMKINTFVTIGSPLGFPIVISKIAKQAKENNNITNIIATPECISNKWVNYSDISDKVALYYKLAELFKPNNNGIYPNDTLVTNNFQINNQSNPHKSFGYLRTAEFSSLLNDFLGEHKSIFDDKIQNQIQNIIDNIRLKGEKIWSKAKSA